MSQYKYKFLKLSLFFLFFTIIIFTTDTFSNSLPWKQKFFVKDFAENYNGWVEIFISTYTKDVSLEKTKEETTFSPTVSTKTVLQKKSIVYDENIKDTIIYQAEIVSDTDLPFWFFSGKSKTYELEFYDKNFLPLESVFKLQGLNENFEILTKRSSDTFNILRQSSKGQVKEKSLPFYKNVLTAGNLRNIVMSLDLTKKDIKTFFLIDKFKLELKRITISSTGKSQVINGVSVYRINIDLNLFGKFTFYIDENYNVVYGEGMGIKVYPEK